MTHKFKLSVLLLVLAIALLIGSGGCTTKKAEVKDADVIDVKPAKNPDEEIPKEITEALADKRPVAIIFYANWDQVSDQVVSYFESTKKQSSYSRVEFVKINIDDPDNAYVIAKFDVGFLPELVVLDGSGKTVMRKNGWIDSKTLQSGVSAALKSPETPETGI